MKISEIWLGPEVLKIKWAVGDNIKYATKTCRHEQKDENNEIVWVELNRLLDHCTIGKNQEKISKYINDWNSGKFTDPASACLYNDAVSFISKSQVILAAKEQGAKFIPLIFPESQIKDLSELLGVGTVTVYQPLVENP